MNLRRFAPGEMEKPSAQFPENKETKRSVFRSSLSKPRRSPRSSSSPRP
ncbi:MAG: hypothetical protein LBD06_11205 [Candidatus Accumulibacter sp.]|nr:hypothetical protein [Accumulibacter sp.]